MNCFDCSAISEFSTAVAVCHDCGADTVGITLPLTDEWCSDLIDTE